MSMTKKATVPANPKLSLRSTDEVRIHNRFAGRPLHFRLPGRSVRLGPGEAATVTRGCLATHELAQLCSAGLVIVEEPTPRKGDRREPSTRSSTPPSKPSRSSSPKKQPRRASKAGSRKTSKASR
jgi:hypothetical protein